MNIYCQDKILPKVKKKRRIKSKYIMHHKRYKNCLSRSRRRNNKKLASSLLFEKIKYTMKNNHKRRNKRNNKKLKPNLLLPKFRRNKNNQMFKKSLGLITIQISSI